MRTLRPFLTGLALALLVPSVGGATELLPGAFINGPTDAQGSPIAITPTAQAPLTMPLAGTLTTPIGAALTPAGMRMLDELRAGQLAHDGDDYTFAVDRDGVSHKFVTAKLKQVLRHTKDTGKAYAFVRRDKAGVEHYLEALQGEQPFHQKLNVETARRLVPHPVFKDLKKTQFMTTSQASAMFHEEAAFWTNYFDNRAGK